MSSMMVSMRTREAARLVRLAAEAADAAMMGEEQARCSARAGSPVVLRHVTPKNRRHKALKVTHFYVPGVMPGGAARLCRANGRFPYTGLSGPPSGMSWPGGSRQQAIQRQY
jgi:hypothetical protein